MTITTLGYACGIGAENPGTALGPIVLQGSKYLAALNLNWIEMLYVTSGQTKLAALPAIIKINERLAQFIYDEIKHEQKFLVLGGDQTASLGTWSGASQAIAKNESLGLIWIDAHMDAHTTETTPSKNLHGMPLAALLGYGDTQMTTLFGAAPKLKPENVILIGIRDYEAAEEKLLTQLGVKIYYMDEVQQKGIQTVITESLSKLKHCDHIGLSIDVDAIDPTDAPATGYPVANGIRGDELVKALKSLRQLSNFIGMEIVEFNPNLDKNQQTEKLIAQLIRSAFS